ncbi:MAG: hypothetical protein COC22_00275, partial [Flavobacteriaceae bacterium]
AGKDIDSVRKHLSRTFLSSSSASGGSTKAIDFSLKAADSQSKMLLSEIKDAVVSVRNSSMGRVEKKEITKQLRSQFSAAKKLRDALSSPRKLRKILEGQGKLKRLQARGKGKGAIER